MRPPRRPDPGLLARARTARAWLGAAAAWCLLIGGLGGCASEKVNSAARGDKESKMAALSETFEKAVGARGREYLAGERILREEPDAAVAAVLEQKARHADPVGRLLADVLKSWRSDEARDFDAALSYLYERAPGYAAKTPMGTPPPRGVAAYLSKHYGPRVTAVLTLRMLKDDTWPDWRVHGVLFYLREHKDLRTTEGLIRFAADSPDPEYRQAAVEVLRDLGDPALSAKIAAERRRRAERKLPMPPEVDALAPRP